jgi:hypothetical protein
MNTTIDQSVDYASPWVVAVTDSSYTGKCAAIASSRYTRVSYIWIP